MTAIICTSDTAIKSSTRNGP